MVRWSDQYRLDALVEFKTEKKAIALANDSDVGLASNFYTRDIGRIWRVTESLAFGITVINEGLRFNVLAAFDDMNDSEQWSQEFKYGPDDYLEIIYMCMGRIDR